MIWQISLFVLVALLIGLVIYSWHVSKPLFDEVRQHPQQDIAPLKDALTFARTTDALYLVTGHEAEHITGINLTTGLGQAETSDVIELYQTAGFDSLAASTGEIEHIAITELVSPLAYVHPGVAAGTNYAEHAEEVNLDDPPFIFPKLAEATNWNAPVNFCKRLDYEAELCMVPLEDIASAADQKVNYGLVLCNDFSDRLTLLKQLKLSEPMGRTGFAAAKGQPGFLPMGYLFVIPRDASFYEQLEFKLYVNDRLRQRFVAGDMILKIEDIVAQAFDEKEATYYNGDEPVSLIPQETIPKGTPLLTGTAAGVMFRLANIWNQGAYLQEGDVVITEGTYLGMLQNQINETN